MLERVDARRDAGAGAGDLRECAVTFAPRACAATTTGTISSAVQGDDAALGAVEVELEEVGAIVELARRVPQQLVRVRAATTRSPGIVPALSSQVPAARTIG